jgi:hypothetical protein
MYDHKIHAVSWFHFVRATITPYVIKDAGRGISGNPPTPTRHMQLSLRQSSRASARNQRRSIAPTYTRGGSNGRGGRWATVASLLALPLHSKPS